MRVQFLVFLLSLSSFLTPTAAAEPKEKLPIPDKLVVLTFDDSVKSHFTVVAPILKKYKFGATFFITEGFEFKKNKQHYMTWEEIARLHRDGFEIGNHTRDHMSLNPEKPEVLKKQLAQYAEQLTHINNRCKEYGIPKTTSFAYPGNGIDPKVYPILRKLGIRFARRGGAPEYPYKEGKGFAYEPALDHPLLIPSAGDARPNWKIDDFKRAVAQAKFGRIVVLQFHGVPDLAHPWVHSPVKNFKQYMQYLHDNKFTVIALRDLEKYVDPNVDPKNSQGVIDDRKLALVSGTSLDNFRKPKNESDLKYWLQNMVWHHRFTTAEIRTATGLSAAEIQQAIKKFNITQKSKPKRAKNSPLLVLPFPGGRHPRIGFRDGMIRPQRETKISVFLPWNEKRYVVVDLPEAIRRNDERNLGLLYLAHTHVPTMWTKRKIPLKSLEWTRNKDGSLVMERTLPNGVVIGTKITPGQSQIRMEMWLINGSKETLSKLRVQNCIMLKDAPEFAQRDNENKFISKPYVAARSQAGNRWIITAWTPNLVTWANPPCPCMHSDPKFPDCKPGETKRIHGRIWFYTGTNIEEAIKSFEKSGWRKKP